MSHMRAFCPHCGMDILPIQPILLNDFSMYGEGSQLCFQGQPIKLTSSEASLCWSLMRAYPSGVRTDVLLDRMDSIGGPEAIQVFICRIRRKLKAVGAPDPFETLRNRGLNRGYRWKLGGKHDAAIFGALHQLDQVA